MLPFKDITHAALEIYTNALLEFVAEFYGRAHIADPQARVAVKQLLVLNDGKYLLFTLVVAVSSGGRSCESCASCRKRSRGRSSS